MVDEEDPSLTRFGFTNILSRRVFLFLIPAAVFAAGAWECVFDIGRVNECVAVAESGLEQIKQGAMKAGEWFIAIVQRIFQGGA